MRFVLVGGLAAIVNIVGRAIISNFVRFELAVVLAFPIALTCAFVMSRRFVFERSALSTWDQYGRFFLVNLFALLQIWIVSVSLVNWLFPAIGFGFHAELIAHAIAVASPVLTSYYAHSEFTFSKARR